MATREIKDAKDLTTNELIYFKGHAKATYMSNGWTVEDAVNQNMFAGYPKITLSREPYVKDYVLSPYTYYYFLFYEIEFGSYESMINIILDESNSNTVGEFIIEFDAATNDAAIPQISFPTDIKWANGIIPVFEMGYRYVVCISNKIACFVKCEN